MAAQTPLAKDDSKASSSNGTSTSTASKISNLFSMKKTPIVSTGRGGAGNIGADTSTPTTSTSLATPTIKSSTYTTGRGGQGNMAPNDPSVPAHAEMARVAQDVGAPASREVQDQGHAYLHHGRGGGGNLVKVEGANGSENGGAGGIAMARVIEGENGDWEEEGTGAPVEPAGAGAGASAARRGSMDKSREASAAGRSQSEKPRQASARNLGPGAGYRAGSEEKLKVSSKAPGAQEVVTGTVQTRGRSVAEGADVEGVGEKGRSGSKGIIGAGKGMLNRLGSSSGKKN